MGPSWSVEPVPSNAMVRFDGVEVKAAVGAWLTAEDAFQWVSICDWVNSVV